jgi:uncharacterized protein YbjT (DUF2867 family)
MHAAMLAGTRRPVKSTEWVRQARCGRRAPCLGAARVSGCVLTDARATDQPVPSLGRVLVAGATGYLGHHLVERLAADGARVRALARRPEQRDALTAASEVFVGQVTEPASLHGVADGVETVFSSIGITRQRDRVGYEDVDYGGNLALLREAERAGVRRFVYVSVLHGRELRDRVRLAAAKERFVDALRDSPVASTVIRPPGYFSDMAAFLDMARKGRAYLIGDGQRRMNPISGADLARQCVDAARAGVDELAVGGPDTLSHTEIAQLAFVAAGCDARIWHVPLGVARAAVAVAERVTPERRYGPLQFFVAVMGEDMVAPVSAGTDHLADFFRTEAARR